MNQEDFNKLKAEVAELKTWKEARERQQITFPLDKISLEILNRNFIMFDKEVEFIDFAGMGNPYVFVKYASKLRLISIIKDIKQYSVATSNIFSCNAHGLVNDQFIFFFTTDTIPTPLVPNSGYYVISATADTFKVSLTSGGAEVDVTDTGTGDQYIYWYPTP